MNKPITIDSLIDDFSLLNEWEDRYRYVIELGKGLEPLPASAHTDANKVRGCASQVWLERHLEAGADVDGPKLIFKGDSDALIVRGLIAILFILYSGRHAREILAIEPEVVLTKLGLDQHLSQQRSNGLRAMVERIRADAHQSLTNP